MISCPSRGHTSFFPARFARKISRIHKVFTMVLPIKGVHVIFPGALRAQDIKKSQGFTGVLAFVKGYVFTLWSTHRIPRICNVLQWFLLMLRFRILQAGHWRARILRSSGRHPDDLEHSLIRGSWITATISRFPMCPTENLNSRDGVNGGFY